MKHKELLNQIENTFGAGCRKICEERFKQIHKHGFTVEYREANPQFYESQQMQAASHSLLAVELYEQAEVYDNVPQNWNFEWRERLCNHNREERLKMSGAFLAAELD